MNSDYSQLLRIFTSVKEEGFCKAMPSPCDLSFIDLANYYRSSESNIRNQVRELFAGAYGSILLGFGSRLAIVADRSNNSDTLTCALIAHSIEDFRDDERDSIIRLSVINHVAGKLKMDAGNLFKYVADLSSDNARDSLLAFYRRSPAMKSISTMKIIEIQTPEGVSYRQE
jgi:hypothetical protein